MNDEKLTAFYKKYDKERMAQILKKHDGFIYYKKLVIKILYRYDDNCAVCQEFLMTDCCELHECESCKKFFPTKYLNRCREECYRCIYDNCEYQIDKLESYEHCDDYCDCKIKLMKLCSTRLCCERDGQADIIFHREHIRKNKIKEILQ